MASSRSSWARRRAAGTNGLGVVRKVVIYTILRTMLQNISNFLLKSSESLYICPEFIYNKTEKIR